MNTNKSLRHLITITSALALAITAGSVFAKGKASHEQAAETTEQTAVTSSEQAAVNTAAQVLEYKLALAEDGKTYQVVMKPSATPKPDLSLTGQVTMKVPHGSKFKVAGLISTVEGSNWVEASRVEAPKEDANSDYISFSFVGLQGSSARNYAWEADKEQVIFSFQNEGGCVDGVSLMANDDPFNVAPNSANTNPGNQFTNLGWGAVSDNNYKGNYGDPIACPK
jgi:hypothetical protein